MKRLVIAAFTASLLATSAAFAMGGTGPTPHTTPSAHPTSSVQPKLTKDVATTLAAAKKAADAGDMKGALDQIHAAQALTDRTPGDDFVIDQFLSAVAANLRDYPTAMGAYDRMLASPNFADQGDDDKKLAYHDGMIVAENVQQWQKVISYGGLLDTLNGNDEITYTTMAIAYYSTKDNKNAAVYAQKAIDYAKANNKTAPEQAQQLVVNGQAASDPNAALANMEQMGIDHNEPDIWYRLTDHAVGARGIKEIDALYLYRLRFMAGAMHEGDDFTIMAMLCEQQGYSTEEVKVYEQGMSAGKVSAGQAGAKLAKARRDAATDSRNLGAIAASAEKSKTGEQDVKLAEDYWGYGRYADAEVAARRALTKGGMKDPSEGAMILGQVLVAEGKFDEAITTFDGVTGSEGRKSAAHLWSVYAKARKKQGH